MNVLEQLRYTKTHEWVEETGEGTVRVGLTDFAQQEMSDLVFVNLQQVGDPVPAGEVFADVESVKAVADIYSPVSGVVTAINETLLDDPGAINADPYGSWFIEVGEATVGEDLLDAAAYTAFCEEEKKED